MPEATLSAPSKRLGNKNFIPGLSNNPVGVGKETKLFEEFLSQPFDDQRKTVDQKWLELAFVLPTRALRFALTATKKEMGQLQQIVTAAAIAKDKRFPNSDESLTIRLPATMLNSYSVSIQVAPTPQPVVIPTTPVSVTDAQP